MCGVAGFLGNNKSNIDCNEVIHSMTNQLIHRGPDSEGSWIDEENGMALGHRRLAIIDLSEEGGLQPMSSPSGKFIISYNGEIFNHNELRKDLEKHYLFSGWRGSSDTETLLLAFELWGIKESLNKLVGQFAFALWDKEEKELFLARDRFGEKPLYYGWVDELFVFSSELKPISTMEGFSNNISRDSLSLFVRHNYVPTPYSIFENIYKLQPGCLLKIKSQSCEPLKGEEIFAPLNKDKISIERWWSLLEVEENKIKLDNNIDTQNMVEESLRDSIKLQAIADVPIGCFLSGGVDSSLISAILQQESDSPINTFTVGFEEEEYSETFFAKKVANHLGTNHTELFVTGEDALKVVPNLSKIYDEPFADASQIPTYLISKLAKESVTVVLSGDAGDELFGGYNRYLYGPLALRISKLLPNGIKKLLFAFISIFPVKLINSIGEHLPKNLKVSMLGDKLYKLSNKLIDTKNKDELYLNLVSEWEPANNPVLGANIPSYFLNRNISKKESEDFQERMMYLDQKTYLTDDILVKVDRASMSVSLETRIPFLDFRLVEISSKLSIENKINGRQGKKVLKDILYKYVPKDLIERPKQGFSVPLDSWLRGPLREWADNLLREERLIEEGFFDAKKIRRYWHEHLSSRHNWEHKLWNILMFQSWMENYEEQRKRF